MTDTMSTDLTTRTGFRFHVRTTTPDDETLVGAFFHHVTPEDVRFRFLSGMKEVSHERLADMTRSTNAQTTNFLALAEDGTPVAVAMLAGDDRHESAEVAVSIRDDHKNIGIGWEMLGHIARYAQQQGYARIESMESRENHAAIDLEKDMGFTLVPVEDDPGVVILRRDLKQA